MQQHHSINLLSFYVTAQSTQIAGWCVRLSVLTLCTFAKSYGAFRQLRDRWFVIYNHALVLGVYRWSTLAGFAPWSERGHWLLASFRRCNWLEHRVGEGHWLAMMFRLPGVFCVVQSKKHSPDKKASRIPFQTSRGRSEHG